LAPFFKYKSCFRKQKNFGDKPAIHFFIKIKQRSSLKKVYFSVFTIPFATIFSFLAQNIHFLKTIKNKKLCF